MEITDILRRIWLFSANKTKSSESFSKQPIQLIVKLYSSLRHIIVTHVAHFNFFQLISLYIILHFSFVYLQHLIPLMLLFHQKLFTSWDLISGFHDSRKKTLSREMHFPFFARFSVFDNYNFLFNKKISFTAFVIPIPFKNISKPKSL